MLRASGCVGDMLKGAEDVRSRLKLMKGVLAGILGGLQEGCGDAAPAGDRRTDVEVIWPVENTLPSSTIANLCHNTFARSPVTQVTRITMINAHQVATDAAVSELEWLSKQNVHGRRRNDRTCILGYPHSL